MTKNLHRSSLSNPMMLMADLGLRALEMTVSSSHGICDGVDRLARAAASNQARMQGTSWSFGDPKRPASRIATSGPAVAPSSRVPALDLVTQAWLQWMSTMGTVASLGAGRGFGATATGAGTRRDTSRAGPSSTEHALASVPHERRGASRRARSPQSD